MELQERDEETLAVIQSPSVLTATTGVEKLYNVIRYKVMTKGCIG